MFNSHNYAYQIEVTVKAMFNCDKYDIGGIADANFIEKILLLLQLLYWETFTIKWIQFIKKNRWVFGKYYLEMGKVYQKLGKKNKKNNKRF